MQAKNGAAVTGNTQTVATDASKADGNETQGGDGKGGVINTQAIPRVRGLTLTGELALDRELQGHYTFEANGGNPTDKSTYAWGDKGTTANQVSSGSTVATSGDVGTYALVQDDVGKVKELSVQAKNDDAVTGNTETVATDASKADGNDTTGGTGSSGQIINPLAKPSVTQLTIKGELIQYSQLSGTYQFNANSGQPDDKSLYLWGEKGSTTNRVVSENQNVPTSGTVGQYAILSSDVGKVLELSVLPKNASNVSGTTVTVATDATEAQGNQTTGGNKGRIITPTAIPSLTDLRLQGHLTNKGTLTATYTFEPNQGNATDQSRYLWGDKGSTASKVATSVQSVTDSGRVPAYILQASDVGKVKEVSVQPRNGLPAPVSGNPQTIATDTAAGQGNETTGGNGQGYIVDSEVKPSVNNVKLQGDLISGKSLSATYTFVANGGDVKDQSKYLWGLRGRTQSGVTSGATVDTSGYVAAYVLTKEDVGAVVEVSVLAINGENVTGNIATLASDAAASQGNNTTGGTNGQVVAPVIASVVVNDAFFNANSGFPTLGFEGAFFTLNLRNALAEDYTWRSNVSWVGVDSAGMVMLMAEPLGQEEVIITATPKVGQGESLHYRFTLTGWFKLNSGSKRGYSQTKLYCNSLGNNYVMPKPNLLTNGKRGVQNSATRGATVRSLWSQWGELRSYGQYDTFWADEAYVNRSVNYYTAVSNNGYTSGYDNKDLARGNACYRAF